MKDTFRVFNAPKVSVGLSAGVSNGRAARAPEQRMTASSTRPWLCVGGNAPTFLGIISAGRSAWWYRSRREEGCVTADIVVIGAGVMGASIALELARAGWTVLVVDKAGGAGHGSTSSSSAIVRFNFSTYAGVAAAWEAYHGWCAWSDHLGCDVGPLARFHRSGLAILDVDVFPRSAYLPLFEQVGVPFEEWSTAELMARVPGIDAGRYWPPKRIDDDGFWADPTGSLGAVYTPDAGFVADPLLAAQNLAVAARRHGAEFRFRATVTEVRSAGDIVTLWNVSANLDERAFDHPAEFRTGRTPNRHLTFAAGTCSE